MFNLYFLLVMVSVAHFLHNYNWQCFFVVCMVDLIVVISSEFGPLSSSKYKKKISQYALKLCHIIYNISIEVYITIYFCDEFFERDVW